MNVVKENIHSTGGWGDGGGVCHLGVYSQKDVMQCSGISVLWIRGGDGGRWGPTFVTCVARKCDVLFLGRCRGGGQFAPCLPL